MSRRIASALANHAAISAAGGSGNRGGGGWCFDGVGNFTSNLKYSNQLIPLTPHNVSGALVNQDRPEFCLVFSQLLLNNMRSRAHRLRNRPTAAGGAVAEPTSRSPPPAG